MKKLLGLTVLLSAFLYSASAPPTCYSRVLSLAKDITDHYTNLQQSQTVDACVKMLPRLYLDIHNYCVLSKLRSFVAESRCEQEPDVNALKDKARNLYTIMISYCRRDVVFLSDDCNALEMPLALPTDDPAIPN